MTKTSHCFYSIYLVIPIISIWIVETWIIVPWSNCNAGSYTECIWPPKHKLPLPFIVTYEKVEGVINASI
jgi:hypothetical protein